MQYRDLAILLFLAALLLSTACRDGTPSAETQETVPQTEAGPVDEDIISTIELDMVDFEAGTASRGMEMTETGMTVNESMDSAELVAPIITSTHPFNYVFPEWDADVPISSTLQIRIRTAPFEGDWGEWKTAQFYPDGVIDGSDLTPGAMIDTDDAYALHDRAQVEITLASSPLGEDPVLRGLNLVFVDSTTGQTTQEILREMEETDGKLRAQSGGYPKPRVISRSQWCSHPDCVYSDGLNYEPVTHLIVHHTVSNNATTDWAANVRAIWTFHTFSREWGDIGYNYLIDPNGNIYEGHIGGDDVIGTHAGNANRGGMGIALLGTFETSRPNATMLNALAELIAWKADQKGIDLWDASKMPLFDNRWGHLHLIGHRDVFGTTVCPGALAHEEIADVRQMAADKMDFVSEYTYLDNLAPQFTQANANWHTGPLQCGFNANSIYTFSTSSANLSTNWGEWRPEITTSGAYEVDAFVPFCATGFDESQQAPYQITHAGGTTNIVRNHQTNIGLWVPLGQYTFTAGGNNVIRLTDLTSSENNLPIWFDAVRIKPLDASASNAAPGPDQSLTNRTVTFRWNLNAGGVLAEQRVQAATDSNFNNLVLDQTVATNARELRHTFDSDYADLHWRIVATQGGGSQIISNSTRFHLDATPPTSRINTVLLGCDGQVTLQWFGEDALSGIQSYDVAYKRTTDADWTILANDTTETSLTFSPPDTTSSYRYRVQAVDGRGNAEPLKENGDLGSEDAIPCNVSAPNNVSPIDTTGWIRENPVTFEWDISAPQAIALYELEVATDLAFSNVIVKQPLPANETQYRHRFEQDFTQLYWRVHATTVFDKQVLSEATGFRFDATAPSAKVTTANQLANGDYALRWEGRDALSGLASYTIQFLGEETSSWTDLVVDTTETEATFTPANPDGLYLFRARGKDWAGNVESAEITGDFNTGRGCPYIGEAATHTLPTDDQWRNSRAVALRWSAQRARCIANATVEVATDAAFTNVIHTSHTLGAGRTSYDYTGDRSASQLFWRVMYTTVLGESFTSEPTRILFDTVSPSSQVIDVKRQLSGVGLVVSAEASDSESGVTRYIFEYRLDGTNTWQRFALGGEQQALFTPPDPAATYWLRVRAIDAAGNMAAGNITGDINTDSVPDIQQIYIPIVIRE